MKGKLDDRMLDELIREELRGLEEGRPKASKTKSGKKVPGKYLTKDKAAMKGEIERVSKLKSDDPSAYGKWVADYKARNTKSGKPHKTKKSAATLAYEKKFGKKNESFSKSIEMNTQDERFKECYDEIDSRLQWDENSLPHYEFDEIADACGLDFEQVMDVFQKYLIEREQKKKAELKDALESILREMDFFNSDFTFKDVLEYWKANNYHNDYEWATKDEIRSVFDEMTTDSNQLKMDLDENVDKALANKAKASGISKSILKRVYSKGAAAWKSGHRPGVSQQQWAMGRVNSFLTGSGGARKADADLWAKAKASKSRKKNESVNESPEASVLRKAIKEIISEIYSQRTESDSVHVDYGVKKKNLDLEELYPLMVGEESVDEGMGKYIAGAALAATLAGGSVQSPAQTPIKDFAKEKVSTLRDKIGNVLKKSNATALSQEKGSAEASIDSLNRKVGKVEKIGDNVFQAIGTASSPNLESAREMARRNGMQTIAQEVKGKEVSPGKVVTSARLSNTRTKDERLFQNADGTYTCFITVASFVD